MIRLRLQTGSRRAHLHFIDNDVCQFRQNRLVFRCQCPWLCIDDAERAQAYLILCNKRGTRVKTNKWLTGDKRVIAKTWILPGIFHYHHFFRMKGMGTERDIAAGLANIKPVTRFEPLPISIYETNQCDRDMENLCCQRGKAIKPRFK